MVHHVNKCIEPEVYLDLNNSIHAYLYGYIWADGHITKAGGLTVSSKECDIVNVLQQTFGGYCKKRTRIQKETGTTKIVYEYFLHRKLFTQQMLKFGFRKCTKSLPIGSQAAFILGFLDGDGCIYHNNSLFQLTFTSNKDQNWTWFTSLPGNEVFKISQRSSWCKSLGRTTHSSIARVTSKKALDILDKLYTEYTGPCLERKKQKYLDYKQFCMKAGK